MRKITRHFSADPRAERSLRHAVRDGIAYSVMSGAGETYFAAYALFLGASAAQISLLAALPALFGAIAQLAAAWLSWRLGRRREIILGAATLHALTWLPIIGLPWLFPQYAVPLMIGSLVLFHVCLGVAAPLWSSLIGDLIPERRRGRYFANRTRLMSITNFAALLLAGVVLYHFEQRNDTRLGFLVIFGVAAAARLLSVYQFAQMHEPGHRPAALALPSLPHLLPRLAQSRFAHFSLFTALFGFAVSVAGPFFTVYMLKDLRFSYLEFTLATAATVLAQFMSLRPWGRIADVFGNRRVMVVTGSLIPFLPALWLISPSFTYVLALQAAGGFLWAGFTLASGNYLYDLVPTERRNNYWAMHALLNSTAALSGALLGALLSTRIPSTVVVFGQVLHWTSGLWGVLLLSALLRGLVVTVFLPGIKEVREVSRAGAREFVLRSLRYSRVGGFALDVLGFGRRRRRAATRARAPETGGR